MENLLDTAIRVFLEWSFRDNIPQTRIPLISAGYELRSNNYAGIQYTRHTKLKVIKIHTQQGGAAEREAQFGHFGRNEFGEKGKKIRVKFRRRRNF